MKSINRVKMLPALILIIMGFYLISPAISQAKEPRGKTRGSGHHEHHGDRSAKRHSNHHQGYDRWRWGLGFGASLGTGLALGIGQPYWNIYRPYWGSSVYMPYRYVRPKPTYTESSFTGTFRTSPLSSSPQQVTTHIEVSHAIKSLPANARVKQQDGRTVYEWQGVEYIYDWQSDSYQILSPQNK
ncbi:hypothetical protein [Shewanella sp. Isolate11]|uniref:hypothetical protein n=1 Tax=Shewanella sp. Isolate11 TaxID=2908530 RepID=UPI001EFC548B|nr:hypothetical protein [Shewanella sp. Isolate11]MCG9695451.1 hypothetical protein [Shewanella sp. Isolate11]